jgi:hypothetical protein
MPVNTPDLAAAWRFDAGSGTTAYDVAAGHDGTLQDNASFSSFSGAPIGQTAAALQSGTQTLGAPDGSVAVSNVSTTGDDALIVTAHGALNGPALNETNAGEDFSQITDDVTTRLNVVWGLASIGSARADVTFDYSGLASLGDPQNVRLLKRSGGRGTPWIDVSDDWIWNESAQTFSRTEVSSFSQYAIGEAATPLPVELEAFDGIATENGVHLSWRTASEQDNAGFRIERHAVYSGEDLKPGEREWNEIGFVQGTGTTAEPQRYQFADAEPPHVADTLAYRLKQIDMDGTIHVTEPVTIVRGQPKNMKIAAYPNPAHGHVVIAYEIPESMGRQMMLQLYDLMGRRVRIMHIATEPGRHEHTMDVSRLPSGTYILRLSGRQSAAVQRLTIVR